MTFPFCIVGGEHHLFHHGLWIQFYSILDTLITAYLLHSLCSMTQLIDYKEHHKDVLVAVGSTLSFSHFVSCMKFAAEKSKKKYKQSINLPV